MSAINCRYLQLRIKCENGLPYETARVKWCFYNSDNSDVVGLYQTSSRLENGFVTPIDGYLSWIVTFVVPSFTGMYIH